MRKTNVTRNVAEQRAMNNNHFKKMRYDQKRTHDNLKEMDCHETINEIEQLALNDVCFLKLSILSSATTIYYEYQNLNCSVACNTTVSFPECEKYNLNITNTQFENGNNQIPACSWQRVMKRWKSMQRANVHWHLQKQANQMR